MNRIFCINDSHLLVFDLMPCSAQFLEHVLQHFKVTFPGFYRNHYVIYINLYLFINHFICALLMIPVEFAEDFNKPDYKALNSFARPKELCVALPFLDSFTCQCPGMGSKFANHTVLCDIVGHNHQIYFPVVHIEPEQIIFCPTKPWDTVFLYYSLPNAMQHEFYLPSQGR